MDSAHDFELLGESVPQVRVLARPLALLRFFNLYFLLIPFFLRIYISLVWRHGFWPAIVSLVALREPGKNVRPHHGFGVSSVRVNYILR